MPDMPPTSNASDPTLAFRALRVERGRRRLGRTRRNQFLLLAWVLVYGSLRLWMSFDERVATLKDWSFLLFAVVCVFLIIGHSLEQSSERHEAERASTLDPSQLLSTPLAKGESVGNMLCEVDTATKLLLRPIPLIADSRLLGVVVFALLAAPAAVKWMKGDASWMLEAGFLAFLLVLAEMLRLKIRRSNFAKAVSIDDAGLPNALVTVSPMNPRSAPLSFRAGDVGRIRFETDGQTHRKQLVFTAASVASAGVPAVSVLRATSEADDFAVMRLHHAITRALAADAGPA